MKKNTLKKELDWVSMLVPLAIVLTVCALFMIFPEGSKLVLSVVRGFLGDDFGLYYALLGVGIVGCTLYIAFSKFGKIKLGDCEKPQYRSFQWGTVGHYDFYIHHGCGYSVLFAVRVGAVCQ